MINKSQTLDMFALSYLKSLMIDQCKHNFDHGIPAAVMKGMDEMSQEVIEGMI